MTVSAFGIVLLDGSLLVMGKVGNDIAVWVSYEGVTVRMTPILAVVMQESRVAHSSRPVGNVSAIVPIRPKRALVIGDGWI